VLETTTNAFEATLIARSAAHIDLEAMPIEGTACSEDLITNHVLTDRVMQPLQL